MKVCGPKTSFGNVQKTFRQLFGVKECAGSRKDLSKAASSILQLPATSASVERSFSAYSCIHSAKRNRLTNDRAGKLVYVSQNLQLFSRCCLSASCSNSQRQEGSGEQQQQHAQTGGERYGRRHTTQQHMLPQLSQKNIQMSMKTPTHHLR